MARSWWALTLVVALAGCGPAPGPPGAPDGTPEVHATWSGCPSPAGRGTAGLPRLGDGFTPVAVVLCTGSLRPVPSGGEDVLAAERRSDSVDALVAALRLPDEPPARGPCTLILVTTPWMALLDAQGRWVQPGVPVNACGQPRREVLDALAALPLRGN